MRRLKLRGRRYLLSQKCVEHISPRHEKPFGKWRVRPRRRRLLSLSQHQVSQKMQKRKTHKTGEALNDQIIQVSHSLSFSLTLSLSLSLSLSLLHTYTHTHTQLLPLSCSLSYTHLLHSLRVLPHTRMYLSPYFSQLAVFILQPAVFFL